MISKFVESRASEILSEFRVKSAPIQVEKIAKNLGLDVVPYDLGSNVSGVLYIQNGKGTIGFNPTESDVRQRFTIAHEIGHQFRANHTFNSLDGHCNGNRNPSTAYEPGSGSTVMSYAGFCGGDDLQDCQFFFAPKF